MKKLFSFIKKYKVQAIAAPVFKMTEALLELFVPIVISNIIDKGIAFSDKPFIIKEASLLFLLAAAGLFFSVTAQYMSAKAAVLSAADMRFALFKHIQSFSFSQYDKTGASSLITRMSSDINQVQTGVNLSLRLLLRSPFIVFGAMFMAFTLDFKSALIFVVTIALLSLIVFPIMTVTIKKNKSVQQKVDKVLLSVRENLTGVRVIRAFGKENEEVECFENRNSSLNFAQKTVGKISALMNPLTLVTVNCAVIVLIYTGALKVDKGVLSAGTVVALYNYMGQILVELVKLANLIINITKSVASAKRISSVFDMSSDLPEGKITFLKDSSVEFSGVSFKYDKAGGNALSDITFKVPGGTRVGIIGGTGSGKSTLVNLIPRFYNAEKGCVKVGDVNVNEIDTSALRKFTGVVSQKPALFKGTVRENLLIGGDAGDDKLTEALKLSESYEFVSKKEGFLDFVIEQGGKNLSGGQRQRLAVARAVVNEPSVLILDDCGSALDYATDLRLRKNLFSLPYNPTVFIVSQRISSVKDCDVILVLENGSLAGKGTHGELLETCEVYSEIYHSQFKKEGE